MDQIGGTLALGRFVRDGAALLLWGGSLFVLLTPQPLRESLATAQARWGRGTAVALAVAVLALLPVQAAALGDGWADALDPGTLGALVSKTTIGTAWLAQAAGAAALLCVPLLPGSWRLHAVAALSAILLASLTLTGHAAMHEGWLGAVQRGNDLLHLLAAGFWFGALPPLLPTLTRMGDPHLHGATVVALRRFSALGHAAVAVVILTGILNGCLILGRWPTDWGSPYDRLLAAKGLLVAAMTALAVLNRYAFVPRLRHSPARGVSRIRAATLAEVALGMGAIALVATFGLLDPA